MKIGEVENLKVANLAEAVGLIEPGNSIAFGGNTMHRVPVAAVREIIHQKKQVNLIKSAGSLEVDALCAAGLVGEVSFAYIGYENFGLALFFRQAVEQGRTKAFEHT